VLESVKDELVAAWLRVIESTVERECRERDLLQKKLGRRLVFSDFWTRFSPSSCHKIHLYLYSVEEGNLVYNGEKFQPLIQMGRILIVGSK
jgi:hypothetical protein